MRDTHIHLFEDLEGAKLSYVREIRSVVAWARGLQEAGVMVGWTSCKVTFWGDDILY